MRTTRNSPFIPGSDQVPEVWAGRVQELADAREAVIPRRLGGVYERGRALLGEFGIGKSVLANRIALEAETAGHWVPERVRVPLGVDPVGLLAGSLRDLATRHSLDAALGERTRQVLERVEEVRLPLLGGGVRTRRAGAEPFPHRLLTELLAQIGGLARRRTGPDHPEGRLLLVRVDEVQNVTDAAMLSQLLTALGDALDATSEVTDPAGLVRRPVLPIAIYLSGLPDFGRAAAEAGATFSRRFRVWELEALTEPEMRAALHPFTSEGWPLLTDDGPASVHLAPEAVDELVAVSLGDPFLFQLAGEAAWLAGTGAVITLEEVRRGWSGSRREVARYVRSRLEGLSPLQLSYLEAAVALPPGERTVAAVAAALGRDSSSALASTAHSLDVERRLLRREAGRLRFRSGAVEAFLGGRWP